MSGRTWQLFLLAAAMGCATAAENKCVFLIESDDADAHGVYFESGYEQLGRPIYHKGPGPGIVMMYSAEEDNNVLCMNEAPSGTPPSCVSGIVAIADGPRRPFVTVKGKGTYEVTRCPDSTSTSSTTSTATATPTKTATTTTTSTMTSTSATNTATTTLSGTRPGSTTVSGTCAFVVNSTVDAASGTYYDSGDKLDGQPVFIKGGVSGYFLQYDAVGSTWSLCASDLPREPRCYEGISVAWCRPGAATSLATGASRGLGFGFTYFLFLFWFLGRFGTVAAAPLIAAPF